MAGRKIKLNKKLDTDITNLTADITSSIFEITYELLYKIDNKTDFDNIRKPMDAFMKIVESILKKRDNDSLIWFVSDLMILQNGSIELFNNIEIILHNLKEYDKKIFDEFKGELYLMGVESAAVNEAIKLALNNNKK